MADGTTGSSSALRGGARTAIALALVVVVPAALTLWGVREPHTMVPVSDDPTPYGYTISLSLFLIPSLFLVTWLLRHPSYAHVGKAFWVTLGLLIPVGFALDVFFATSFFTFLNAKATLGIAIPVVGGSVPVEEFAFYALGFFCVLLLYVWCDEYWLAAYRVAQTRSDPRLHGVRQVFGLHRDSLLAGAVLFALALLYKKLFSPVPDGIPGYFAFLLVFAIMPSVLLFSSVRPFVNWRALSFTFTLILLISLLWEATLAAPYQWWGYQPQQMMGIFIEAWSDLPLEAALLWLAVSYTTVMVYEAVKLFLALEKPWQQALFGPEPAGRGNQAGASGRVPNSSEH